MPVGMTAAIEGLEHHPHARAVLGAALAPGGRPSHAYLLHGPAGTGKRAAARAFAAELLAEGAADPESARARVASGVHPDLTWVAPTGVHEMRVEDVAEPVVAAATRTPFEARRRVFVLERADTLNDQAANRLLKTLEEPAAHVHLLLLSDRLGEVLPTIISRCQLVRFDPLPAEEIERRLEAEGVGGASARAAARLALGDAGRALELASGDGPALRAEAEHFAREALADDLGDRPWLALLKRARAAGEHAVAELEPRLAEDLELASKRDRKRVETEWTERFRRVRRRAETGALDLQLELAGLWYRDLVALAAGAEDLVLHADRFEELAADLEGRDPVALREGLELVEDARRRLRVNVSEELACEALAYRLAAVLVAPAAVGAR
jgi:DNA polymerase III subunit delta'